MPKTMTLRLADDQAEQIETFARVEGIPVSEAVRRAIEEQIEKRRTDRDFQERLRKVMDENRKALERLAG